MAYYGPVSTTLVADTVEALQVEIDRLKKYPDFSGGKIWSTENAPKFKRLGKYASVVNYFQND